MQKHSHHLHIPQRFVSHQLGASCDGPLPPYPTPNVMSTTPIRLVAASMVTKRAWLLPETILRKTNPPDGWRRPTIHWMHAYILGKWAFRGIKAKVFVTLPPPHHFCTKRCCRAIIRRYKHGMVCTTINSNAAIDVILYVMVPDNPLLCRCTIDVIIEVTIPDAPFL